MSTTTSRHGTRPHPDVADTTDTSDITDTVGIPVTHLDPDLERIERSIALLSDAGLVATLICDGSCRGVSGCSVAPLAAQNAVAAQDAVAA